MEIWYRPWIGKESSLPMVQPCFFRGELLNFRVDDGSLNLEVICFLNISTFLFEVKLCSNQSHHFGALGKNSRDPSSSSSSSSSQYTLKEVTLRCENFSPAPLREVYPMQARPQRDSFDRRPGNLVILDHLSFENYQPWFTPENLQTMIFVGRKFHSSIDQSTIFCESLQHLICCLDHQNLDRTRPHGKSEKRTKTKTWNTTACTTCMVYLLPRCPGLN